MKKYEIDTFVSFKTDGFKPRENPVLICKNRLRVHFKHLRNLFGILVSRNMNKILKMEVSKIVLKVSMSDFSNWTPCLL